MTGYYFWFVRAETNLNTGIIGGPGNEGDLVAANMLVDEFKQDKGYEPETVARCQAILEVVDGVTGALANGALSKMLAALHK